MGFFDDVGSAIGHAVQTAGGALGGVARTAQGAASRAGSMGRSVLGSAGYLLPETSGSMLIQDYTNMERKRKEAEDEEAAARQRLEQSVSEADRLRAQQGLFAAQLKKNALRDQGLLMDRVASGERRAMAEKIAGQKQGAASRGLLGSGFQKAGEARARSEAAAGTAEKQRKIQQMSSEQIADAEDLQAQLGLEMGGVQQNMADQYYRMAIQNMQSRNAAIGDLLSGAGALGGAYAARQRGSV